MRHVLCAAVFASMFLAAYTFAADPQTSCKTAATGMTAPATSAAGFIFPHPSLDLRDFQAEELETRHDFVQGPISIAQYYEGEEPPPARKGGLELFPGPILLSVDFGISVVPVIGSGAADDASPRLAGYREYWSTGAGLNADLHLHVLPTADAYIGVGFIHHSSTGTSDWFTTFGTSDIHVRYKFDPLYFFTLEFGGKGYLPLNAPPGLGFLDAERRAPMLYLRAAAGPILVSKTNLEYKRFVDGVLAQEFKTTWWPQQTVLGVHLAAGLEWGGFRPSDAGTGFGLFAEFGFRYISAPVVTDFTDTSDPMYTLVVTLGIHLP